MEIEAPLLPQKQEQTEETITPVETTEQSSAHVFEKPKNVMKHRPAPAYDIHKKNSADEDEDEADEETDETEEDEDDTTDDESDVDPVDDEEDGTEDEEEEDDDDDDDETGTDGGEEDENEFVYDANKPLPQQKLDPNLLRIKQDEDKNKKKKVTPHGPEKVDRSPWQQMVDFLVHGAKEAMIKNGDMPIKPRLSDKILLGLGLKSIKEDILLAEGAEKFWKLKGKGEKASMRLINTDRISKKVKKEENRLNKPRKLEEKRLIKQRRYKNQIERIMKERRDQKISLQTEKQNELTRTVRDATQKTLAHNKHTQPEKQVQVKVKAQTTAQKQTQIAAQSQIKAQQQIQEQIKQSATKQAEQQRNQQKLLGLSAELNQLKTPTRQGVEQNTIQAPKLPKTEAEKQATPKAQETKARKEGMETAIVQSIQNNIQAQNQANIQNNIQAQNQANIQNNIQAQQQATMQNIQAQNQAIGNAQFNAQQNAQQTASLYLGAMNMKHTFGPGKHFPLHFPGKKPLGTHNSLHPQDNSKPDSPPSDGKKGNPPSESEVKAAGKEAKQALIDTVNITAATIAVEGARQGQNNGIEQDQNLTDTLAQLGAEVGGASTTPLSQNQPHER